MALWVLQKKKFSADGIFKAELSDLFTYELVEGDCSGIEFWETMTRTEIIIFTTRTQNVLGEKGPMDKGTDCCNPEEILLP